MSTYPKYVNPNNDRIVIDAANMTLTKSNLSCSDSYYVPSQEAYNKFQATIKRLSLTDET
jgi:hypothetical protein